MIQLPLAFQSGDTLLAELDPDHYITDKKRVVAKLTADNLWVKPVVPIVPSEFVSIANAEHKRLTEPYRWMQEYQKTQVFKHLGGQHDQATHGRKKFNYFTAGSLFKDQDSLQSSIEGLTDPNKSRFANGNVAIKVLLERQGKGGQPDVFDSIEELREVNPDAEIIYRGTDESYKDSMFNDDYDRTGTGAFGEGYYFTSSQPEATSYAEGGRTANHTNPTVIQGAMKPNARVKVFSGPEELDDYGRDAMNKAVRDIEATGLDSRTISPDGRSTTSISDFTTSSFYNTHTTAASTQLILEGFDAMQFVSDYSGRNTYTVVFNREAMQVVAD